MTGIQIKLNRDTPAGPDVETVYFATMRKCPKLRELLRAYLTANVAKVAAMRRNEILVGKLSDAGSNDAVDAFQTEFNASVMAVEDAAYSEAEALWGFFKEGFIAAGYDEATAERLASDIPQDRVNEVISASRTGAGMLDFSSPSKQ